MANFRRIVPIRVPMELLPVLIDHAAEHLYAVAEELAELQFARRPTVAQLVPATLLEAKLPTGQRCSAQESSSLRRS